MTLSPLAKYINDLWGPVTSDKQSQCPPMEYISNMVVSLRTSDGRSFPSAVSEQARMGSLTERTGTVLGELEAYHKGCHCVQEEGR